MNKLLQTFLILAVALIFVFSTNAQTPAPNADEIQRIQLVNALERAQTEVKASRKLIDAMRDSVEAKEKRITALDQKDALSAKAIAGLQSEIVNLRAAISSAESALEIRKKEVAELKKDLDKTRKKLRRAREVTKILVVAAGILGAIVVLK